MKPSHHHRSSCHHTRCNPHPAIPIPIMFYLSSVVRIYMGTSGVRTGRCRFGLRMPAWWITKDPCGMFCAIFVRKFMFMFMFMLLLTRTSCLPECVPPDVCPVYDSCVAYHAMVGSILRSYSFVYLLYRRSLRIALSGTVLGPWSCTNRYTPHTHTHTKRSQSSPHVKAINREP